MTRALPFHMSECDTCGSQFASEADLRFNKRVMIAFEKEVEGLLTGEAVRAARLAAGLTQEQAAKIFGGGKVAFSKYEKEVITQSAAMDKLIRVATAVPSAMAWLAHHAGEHDIATNICSNEVERISALVKAACSGKNVKQVVHAALQHGLLDSPVSCYSKVFVDEIVEEDAIVASEPVASGRLLSFGRYKHQRGAFEISITDDFSASNGTSPMTTYRMAA
ncbi:type II TA system antitoxin MqsA family protein [Cupriavidus basilensis]